MKKKPMSRKEYTTFMKLIARRAKAEEAMIAKERGD